MAHELTPTVAAAVAAANVPLLLFAELAFDAGALRVTNAGYDQTWNGHTWTGVGQLGSIDAVQEGADLQAYGIRLALSGIPPDYVAAALGEHYQGRPCKVWLAFLDPASYAVLADPVLVFSGRMDTMDVDMGSTATITVSAESRLIDLERARVRRFNHEDQQIDYPGDKGFEFVALMVERELLWGKES